MDSYRTEEEQLEALKRWWKEHGRSALVGVVLALGLGFGWQFWQGQRHSATEDASAIYQQMLLALSGEDTQGAEPVQALARRLKASHPGTTYARFAALHLARLAVLAGEPEQAEVELRWVLSMARAGDDLHQVATLRLARLLASRGDTDRALELLAAGSGDYEASYSIARGDIFLQLNREPEALAAYETALAALDSDAPVPRTLREKLQYLNARRAAPAEAG